MNRLLGAVGLHVGNPRPQIFIAVQNVLRIQQLLDGCPADLGNLVGRAYRNIGLVFFTLENGVPEEIGRPTLANLEGVVVHRIVECVEESRLFAAFSNGRGQIRDVVGFAMPFREPPFARPRVVD